MELKDLLTRPHSEQRRLTESEQQEIFAVACQSFNSTRRQFGRVRAAKKAMQEHATKLGWEDILIQIAAQVVAKLITEWIKKKFQSAPSAVSIGAFDLPNEAIGDDDPDSD